MDANTHPAGAELTGAESGAAEAADAAPWDAVPADAALAHADADADSVDAAPGPPSRPAGAWLGVLAVVLAAVCAILVAVGVALALTGDFAVATLLAQLAIGCSIAAIVIGVVSIVLGRGRRWGIAGCVLGFLANPLVAVVALRTVDGI